MQENETYHDYDVDELISDVNELLAEHPVSKPQKKISPVSKQNRMKKILYYSLLGVFCVTFLVSAVFLISYFVESGKSKSDYDDLSNIVDSLRPEQTVSTEATEGTDGTEGTQATTPTGTEPDATEDPTPVILPEYAGVYELNPDLVGWIKIDGTTINYPVMQTSHDRPDYYLEHNFNGESSKWGCIYVREECDVFAPSDNVTIYGHYKSDGTMFHDLHNLRKKAYWQEHRYITFDTIYERHTYEIIAVFKTSANLGEGFAYHVFDDAYDEADFNEYIDTVHSLQFFNTGVTAEYGDKLITLSTCEYTLNNGRLAVVAKRIS